MPHARPPSDEAGRLASLRRCCLLHAPPDEGFDRLTRLAARTLGVPEALITLVDQSRPGAEFSKLLASSELPASSELVIVEDALRDPRFADSPLVRGAPGLRFYAAASLLDRQGRTLGALCLLDIRPRVLDAGQRATLRDLADCAETELELRLARAEDAAERRQAEQALRRSEERKSAILEASLDCIISMGADGRVTEWNAAAEKTFGWSRAEALGQELAFLIVPPALRDAHMQGITRCAATGQGSYLNRRIEMPARRRDGTEFTAELTIAATAADGAPLFTAALRDVTERRQAEEALRRSERMLSLHVQQTPMAVIEWSPDFRVTAWNPAAERIFGYTREEALGRYGPDLILSEEVRPHVEAIRAALLSGRGGTRSTNLNRTKEGREIICEWYNTPLVDEGGCIIGAAALAQDVTQSVRDEEGRRALLAEREALLAETKALLGQTETLLAEARERADRDPLTGLLNHRAFHKRLEEAAEAACGAARPLALLLLDLDNFKGFNDAHGHRAGDEVLRRAADALRAVCPEGGVLARFGGDEFALLLPGADEAEAARTAGLLGDAAAGLSFRPPGYTSPVPLSFAVGRAGLPGDGPGRAALLEAADARLRVAKSGGDAEGQADLLRRDMAHAVGGFSMLDALVTSVDNKDRYTRRHSEDVLVYSLEIARALGLDAKMQHDIQVSALLHDVGKIGVPDHVLRKPSTLTEAEFEAVMQHPMMGAVIVGAVPGFEESLDAVRHHHERWDGGGYPFGLRGEEIPLTARLLAVADAYSAMTTDRPYRKGMAAEKAREILAAGAGTQWDPVCVAAFLGPQEGK